MTTLATYCDSYVRITRDYDHDALDINRVRRFIQTRVGELDAARRARLVEADQRLLAIARAETDPSDQVDLWDVLSYIGFPAEGPVRVA